MQGIRGVLDLLDVWDFALSLDWNTLRGTPLFGVDIFVVPQEALQNVHLVALPHFEPNMVNNQGQMLQTTIDKVYSWW